MTLIILICFFRAFVSNVRFFPRRTSCRNSLIQYLVGVVSEQLRRRHMPAVFLSLLVLSTRTSNRPTQNKIKPCEYKNHNSRACWTLPGWVARKRVKCQNQKSMLDAHHTCPQTIDGVLVQFDFIIAPAC